MTKIENTNSGRGEIPHIDGASATIPKRKRGRPPKVYESPDANQRVLIKARRGRPMGAKNKPKAMTHGIIELLKAEIAEAVELQRAHFPNDDELTLRNRAEQFRWQRYRDGRWPRFAAIAKREADEKAAAASRAAAEKAEAATTDRN